jgi:hypothetical protein
VAFEVKMIKWHLISIEKEFFIEDVDTIKKVSFMPK